MLSAQRQFLTERIRLVLATLLADASPLPAIDLERPKVAEHGDFATNIALQVAKTARKNPRDLAQGLAQGIMADPQLEGLVAAAEVAGPGFVNLRICASAKQEVIKAALAAGSAFGQGKEHSGQRIIVEFVSANPTGPLHVGHGRQAVLGDALSALLESQGWDVTREFYYNDAGVQIANLARSIQHRILGLKPGDKDWNENNYAGDYIAEIGAEFLAGKTVQADDRRYTASGRADDLDSITQFAVAFLRHEQDLDLQALGVAFDNYYLESSLYSEGRVEQTVRHLIESGKTYEADGALWLRTTDYGDDKDRVMRKSDGTYTYFVPDIAYHVTKWQRHFTEAINVQGSDHHGTMARVRAGLQALALGMPSDYPRYLLHKMVRVMRGGEEVKMSKRAGSVVTVRDLIDWVGRDAVRFFLLSRKADTEFTFDVDLALSQSEENPVYYVQYAHARICSVMNQWRERDQGDPAILATADLAPLVSPRELTLLQRLGEFPDVVHQAALDMAPHQVAFYLKDCAADLHTYYNAERVLVDDAATRQARLALLAATRQVLVNGLTLLGVAAPEKM